MADKPVILLLKVPIPPPSDVLLLEIVGLCDVLQQTPRTVTVAPPSEVIFPPPDAVVDVMFEIEVVTIVAKVIDVFTVI